MLKRSKVFNDWGQRYKNEAGVGTPLPLLLIPWEDIKSNP